MLQLKGNALPGAWICNPQDRGRKSIKDGKIYLNQDQEFVIELFNPLQKSILADIKIEGKSVSSTGLVINPGQRAYLECFVDNKRKFIFKTYEVDGEDKIVQNAIKNNGLVEIFFYEEQIINYYPNWNTITLVTQPYWNGYYSGNITTNNTGNFYCSGNIGNSTTTSNTANLFSSNVSNTSNVSYSSNIETGKVEGGDISNQKFQEVYKNFNSFVLNKIEYKLLPASQKPHEPEVKKQPNNNWKNVLIQLKDLYDIGVLTSDEYEKKKNEILSRV
jgi:hypothetical protein